MIEKTLQQFPIHYWDNQVNSQYTIVFLHPAFADHTCFDAQTDYFANRYRIITLDLLGHGKSLGRGKLSDTALVLQEIMEIENIQRINLVGVSLGAVLAQDFANRYPNRLASLCCVGGYDINHFDSDLQKENGKAQRSMMWRAMCSIRWFAQENKKISAYTDTAQERFYQMNLRFRKSSFRHLASLAGMINRFQTQKRDYPLLIGVGEYDQPAAQEASVRWHEQEPDSELVFFCNAGHIANMDSPETFCNILEKILR